MKIFKILLITVLVFSFSMGTITNRKINMVMKTLPNEIVMKTILNKSTPICNGFWQKSGYVCDPKKTLTYNTRDQAMISRETKMFFTIVGQIKEIWEKGQKYFKSLDKKPASAFKFFAAINTTTLETDANKCWDQMKRYRSTSLCFSCSANNYKYYLGKLAIISMDSCLEMISDCQLHFGSISNLHVLVYYAKDIIQEISKVKPLSKEFHYNLDLILAGGKKKKWDRLGNIMLQMILAILSGSKNFLTALNKEVCEGTIFLRGNPIILNFFDYVEHPIRMIHQAAVGSSRALSMSNWRSLSALDDYWTKYFVNTMPAEVTVLSDMTVTDNTNMWPMNMSLAFP